LLETKVKAIRATMLVSCPAMIVVGAIVTVFYSLRLAFFVYVIALIAILSLLSTYYIKSKRHYDHLVMIIICIKNCICVFLLLLKGPMLWSAMAVQVVVCSNLGVTSKRSDNLEPFLIIISMILVSLCRYYGFTIGNTDGLPVAVSETFNTLICTMLLSVQWFTNLSNVRALTQAAATAKDRSILFAKVSNTHRSKLLFCIHQNTQNSHETY
jgi:hypothetical protein